MMQRIVKRPARAGVHGWTHRIRQTVGIDKSGTGATRFIWMEVASGVRRLPSAEPVRGQRIAKRSRWKGEYDCSLVAAAGTTTPTANLGSSGIVRNRERETDDSESGNERGPCDLHRRRGCGIARPIAR